MDLPECLTSKFFMGFDFRRSGVVAGEDRGRDGSEGIDEEYLSLGCLRRRCFGEPGQRKRDRGETNGVRSGNRIRRV